MHKTLFYLLFCLITASAMAATVKPPKPVEGTPSVFSPNFSIGIGNFNLKITPPQGWGIGDFSASADGGNFRLYPNEGGYGASLEIAYYDSPSLAQDAVTNLKKGFSPVSNYGDGFEVVKDKACYYCSVMGQHVLQIWYTIPKKKIDPTLWTSLKSSVSIWKKPPPPQPPIQDEGEEFSPITKEEFKGWWCHHPSGKLHVLFESFPVDATSPNIDETSIATLTFNKTTISGFFYVKWDQTNLTGEAPFRTHLEEMKKDILKKNPGQKMNESPYFGDGYAIHQGHPYHFLTVAGDGFLFGFAVRIKLPVSYDLNELVRNVKWVIEE